MGDYELLYFSGIGMCFGSFGANFSTKYGTTKVAKITTRQDLVIWFMVTPCSGFS